MSNLRIVTFFSNRNTDVTWIGHVGVYGHCGASSPSQHQMGKAWDLTKINMQDGDKVDMNWSWRPERSLKNRRLYLAVAAMCRHRMGTVLTAGWQDSHYDHIHMDNGAGIGPINDESEADTRIIQRACNWLDSAGLTVDGDWGSATETAFIQLRNKLVGSNVDIRGNLADTRTFLATIAYRGFDNEAA